MFNMRGIVLGLVALLVLCGAAVSQPFGYVVGPSGGCVLVTGSGGCVGQTSPTLITPVLGVATGTSLALGGATIGTDALAVTGTATISGQVIVGNGTKTVPSIGYAGATGNGWYWRAGVGIALAGNTGKEIVQFGSSGGIATAGNSIGVIAGGGGDVSTTSTNTIWTSSTAATWQSGSIDVDTAPVAQTLRSQGALAGGTSNVAGANWTFIASPGKGTGAGGSFIFQTTPAGSSGTVVGTPTTAMTIDSTQRVTFAGGTTFNGALTLGSNAITGANEIRANSTSLLFRDSSAAAAPLLQLGGTTSSFPAIKRNGTALNFRLADDSADAAITAAGITTSGQIVAASMTQTSAAQSGTVCFAAAGLTYDASLGCLASLEELKNIRPGGMPEALADIRKLKPFWFNWKSTAPEWKGGNHETLPGLGAHATEAVDKRLVGYGPDGKLRGVHYPEMIALLVAGMQQQQKQIDGLTRRVAVLERRR